MPAPPEHRHLPRRLRRLKPVRSGSEIGGDGGFSGRSVDFMSVVEVCGEDSNGTKPVFIISRYDLIVQSV